MSPVLSCALIMIGLLSLMVLLARKPGVTLKDVEKETEKDLLDIEREVVEEVKEELRGVMRQQQPIIANENNGDGDSND